MKNKILLTILLTLTTFIGYGCGMESEDESYQNAMRNLDEESAKLESEKALQQVIFFIMADNMEVFKQYQDNPALKKWLADMVFNMTYNPEETPYTSRFLN